MDIDEESSMTSLASRSQPATEDTQTSEPSNATAPTAQAAPEQAPPVLQAPQNASDPSQSTVQDLTAIANGKKTPPLGYAVAKPADLTATPQPLDAPADSSFVTNPANGEDVVMTDPNSASLNGPAVPTVRGRGRGPGRPRGSRARGTPRGTPRGTTRGGGRGGSGHGTRGGKRKRANREDDEDEDDDDDLSDSSVEITPNATQTKSGRSIQKPTVFFPPPVQASPGRAASSSGAATGNNGPTGPDGTNPGVVKKKRMYRRNPEAAVCKVCLRGVSPASNMIVFCDGCNSPYHRYCHYPIIDQAVIDELDKEWYCRVCVKPEPQPARAQNGASSHQATANGEETVDIETFVAASGSLQHDEIKRCLQSLPQRTLIQLLVKAYSLKPDLPILPPDYKTRLSSNTSASSNGKGVAHSTTQDQSQPSSYYDRVPIEHPDHYPRPGHGLMKKLPPDSADVSILVDDEDKYGVFSHVYQTNPVAANTGLSGNGS